MTPRKLLAFFSFLLLIAAGLYLQSELDDTAGSPAPASVPAPASASASASSPTTPAAIEPRAGRFAVVSDTQRTTWMEELILRREQNDGERARLIQDLAAQDLDFVALLGDLVGWSGRSEWERWDTFFAPVRARGIPLLPLVGNHDLWGAFGHFTRRFPDLRQHRWYARRYGVLKLLWLDSNLEKLGAEAAAAETQWFERELNHADSDPEIRGVLVFLHHSPFTNSRTTGDVEPVIAAFVPPFARARKTLALIGGHAHAYEHFAEGGKTYLVAGGGGGPRVRLLEGAEQRHADLFHGPAPRPIHYLLIQPGSNGVEITARGFERLDVPPHEIDRVVLPFTDQNESRRSSQ